MNARWTRAVFIRFVFEHLFLETSFGQIEAQKFYERLGFQKARFDRPYSVEWPKWLKSLLDISYVACYKRHE